MDAQQEAQALPLAGEKWTDLSLAQNCRGAQGTERGQKVRGALPRAADFCWHKEKGRLIQDKQVTSWGQGPGTGSEAGKVLKKYVSDRYIL